MQRLKNPFITLFILLTFCSFQETVADNDKYMGTATCASSNCHGGTAPRNATNVLQNEYVTWSKKDAHSKAWRVLTTEDSKKIAHNLGIGDPSKEPLCLNCHTTYIADNLKGEKFTIEDGVSCESCHGPAERWLQSHTSSRSSHSDNLSRGLRDLKPLDKRANLCLDCHYGNDDQFVDHKLIGAGHPRLSFELDTFTMIQPRHWDYDEDYIKRKGEYNAVKAWLIGQLELSIRMVQTMASDTRSKNGIWPELSLFNCYSCHHSLKEGQWRKREYKNGPGELRLNISSFLVLKSALDILDPNTAGELSTILSKLHEDYKSGNAKRLLEDLTNLLSTNVRNTINASTLSLETRRKLLKGTVTFANQTSHFQYEEAEQIIMGISAILATDKELEKKLKVSVDQAYNALATPEEFISENFSAAIKLIAAKLSTIN